MRSIIGESPLSTMAPRFVRDGIPVLKKRGMESKDLGRRSGAQIIINVNEYMNDHLFELRRKT